MRVHVSKTVSQKVEIQFLFKKLEFSYMQTPPAHMRTEVTVTITVVHHSASSNHCERVSEAVGSPSRR